MEIGSSWSKPFIKAGALKNITTLYYNLGSVERGMMGSVVVLLHSTGQTQVISSSQGRTRHSRATEDPHGESSRVDTTATVLRGATEEMLHTSNVNSSCDTTI